MRLPKILPFLEKYFFVILLLFFELILFAFNYKPHTWLAGWDNQHPNLNFAANFERSLFGVWQEYRGLGFFDGMAHTANLIHTAFIYLLSFILPVSFLRWFFHFLMHFLGGLGVYFLGKEFFKDRLIGFLSSIFYFLNFGTIQMFYTPLEVFSFHFAALPWLSLYLIKYLKSGLKKDIILFLIISLLFTPQFFVPTFFIVYLLSATVILIFHCRAAKFFQKAVFVLAVILSVNTFWLLPYVYGVFQNAKTITTSKINQISNENIILKNKKFGNFSSVALIKGFSLDFVDQQNNGNADYLMRSWRNHFENKGVVLIGWLFFALAVLGIAEVLKTRRKDLYPFLILFLISFLMLGSDIPVSSFIIEFLSKHIPFFAEAFRFVFTKFSILYVLSYSLLLGAGVKIFVKLFKTVFTLFLLSILFIYSLPAFKGNFFYQNLRVNVPREYFDLIEYFKNQNKNGRLVILPQPHFWGWTRYQWGFRGSGFIWQGLPQASMDGAFLPWSKANENFYWEISYAIQSQNVDFFRSILRKYQINWVVLDENIRGDEYKALYFEKTNEMLTKTSDVFFAGEFGSGARRIKVYKTDFDTAVQDFVSLAEGLPSVAPSYQWNDIDTAYLEGNDYVTDGEIEIYYPFASLFSEREQGELEFAVEDSGEFFIFSASLPADYNDFILQVPELTEVEEYHWSEKLEKEPIPVPDIQLADGRVKVKIEKKKNYFSYDSDETGGILDKIKPENCDPFNIGLQKREVVNEDEKKLLRLTSQGSNNCLSVDLPLLNQENGYLIKIQARYFEGKSLLIYMINKTSESRFFEVQLPKDKKLNDFYFVIPPMQNDGVGYSLHFDNIAIGRQKTVNELKKVEVYPIPYRFLKQIKLISRTNSEPQVQKFLEKDSFQVSHSDPSFYKVKLTNFSNTNSKFYLILSQSFDRGWLAFYLEGLKPVFLREHILVNNWANGWKIVNSERGIVNNQTGNFYVVFWPQLLEFFGFFLLLVVVLRIFTVKRRNS